jgi:hypothetical protein
MARSVGPIALILVLVAAACGDAQSEIPGLDPADEISIVEVEPDPDDDSFDWSTAYQVGDLPKLNVGHPSAQFLEDAARVDADPEDYVCLGDASGGGSCDVDDPSSPSISGITFGGPWVMAWSWGFVPEDAVAVRFVGPKSEAMWQRPIDRTVIFPNPDPEGSSQTCVCRLDAIDADGSVILSVDLETLS